MKCVNDHCPFNSDEANDGCLIIPEDMLDNMAGECPKKIVVPRANVAELEADKDRLDWLEWKCEKVDLVGLGWSIDGRGKENNIRIAIDKAKND